jgi:cob(I)alamin adenosyltransferase
MGYRLSKIYTRTGDDGLTNLGDGNRLPKNHPRLELLGTLDELNSAIGLILAHEPQTESIRSLLNTTQQELFNIGGELCPPHHQAITADKVVALETAIDEWNTELPPLKEFILPGGNLKTASCHLARTICRRAERCAVTLQQAEAFNPDILRFINRLSDALFVAARLLAKETGSKEVLWEHERPK